MVMILQLIQNIENDDERATVERIFHQYYKFMIHKANGILNNYHDAEDAVMDTFCRITENVKFFMNLGNNDIAALVCIYTRNTAINMYNRKKKQNEIFDMYADIDAQTPAEEAMQDSPESLIINAESILILRNAIDQLDSKYRDAIILKYYYHMRNFEIADVMHLERNTVNSHISRAKKKLKEILGEAGYERITY